MAALNFPDVNVWLALAWSHHQQSPVALRWFNSCGPDRFYFCRVTQLSLLRLLTTTAVMGEDTLTMPEAWSLYDQFLADARVELLVEPPDLDRHLRKLTRSPRSSPKLWADAYLAAFADAAGIRLVTFDTAFASRDIDVLVLT